jgi:uncharacterized membrane protein YhaH (DUF805 family)
MFQSYLNALKRYADFEGRTRRKEYWAFAGPNMAIFLVLYVVYLVITMSYVNDSLGAMGQWQPGMPMPQPPSPPVAGTVLFWVAMLFGLGTTLPGMAANARRLHDTGRSGWLQLLGMIPLVGTIILIVFFSTDGDQGPNEYGPDPKNPHAMAMPGFGPPQVMPPGYGPMPGMYPPAPGGVGGMPGGYPMAAAPGGYPQGGPPGFPHGAPAGFPQGAPAGFPQGAPAGFPQGTPTGFPQGTPTGFPQGAPAGYGPVSGYPQSGPPQPYYPQGAMRPPMMPRAGAAQFAGPPTGFAQNGMPQPVSPPIGIPGYPQPGDGGFGLQQPLPPPA